MEGVSKRHAGDIAVQRRGSVCFPNRQSKCLSLLMAAGMCLGFHFTGSDVRASREQCCLSELDPVVQMVLLPTNAAPYASPLRPSDTSGFLG